MIESRPGGSLLEAYVADLERRLAAADPAERADIVASVREHVEADLALLGRPSTPADVEASLGTLGTVDTVVAAWAPDAAAAGTAHGPLPVSLPAPLPTSLPTPAPAEPPAPLTTRARVLLAVGLAAGIALALAFPLAWLLLPPVVLVLGIMGARRHPARRAPWVVTAVVGGVLLLVSPLVAAALALVVVGSSETSVDNGPTVQEGTATPGG